MAAENAGVAPRVAVLGCGSIGRRHVANLKALGVEAVAVYDPVPERLTELRAAADVTAFAALDDIWRWEPTVVFVTAPTSCHLELALAAAERGCHLFIEKPLADRLAGTEQLVALVRERGLVSLVGCNLRFQPGLQAVKRWLEAGAIGRVVAARIEFGQYLPDWRPGSAYQASYSARRALGGGIILDAIHEIDYARWLLGEPLGVACFAGTLSHLEIETEDTAALLLRLPDAIVEIHLDYVQRVYSRTCQIIGDEGTIRWDYSAGEARYYHASGACELVFNPPAWTPNEMYLAELRHFLDCLAGRAAPALDVAGGRRVLEIALAAKQAAAEGRVIALGGADA
ncbi:MAG: Gfo/Idh/MocA family oxidoreductase [Chloroflexota bacterium]|nr:Gfo/Idh/MocA family oxidoreductase [Dehalococcoidia bacterium]MDW8254592.1 Gfo/Idh/MocA family oxidoreductase [Chloroflexota bacterium]